VSSFVNAARDIISLFLAALAVEKEAQPRLLLVHIILYKREERSWGTVKRTNFAVGRAKECFCGTHKLFFIHRRRLLLLQKICTCAKKQ